MDDPRLFFNGLDGATGGYLTEPLSERDVSRLAQGKALDETPPLGAGESQDPDHANDLKARVFREGEAHFGVIEGVDPKDLAQAGWGVIFAHDADPSLRVALKELLDHRKSQAGARKENRYREYTGPNGYRVGDPKESKRAFLGRNGAAAGMAADPDKVPYYLLIVGDPAVIPFHFQYQLDVEYAVGRLWFEKDGKPDLDAFARYARSVVEAESGAVSLPRAAAFLGVKNDDDRSTALSADELVGPLAETLTTKYPGWTFRRYAQDHAYKPDFARLIGGPDTPAVLFTASHGVGFPNGHARQFPHQGALVCQEWPGPENASGEIPHDHLFAAEDVGDDARLFGLIAFHFACYGAGTPDLNDFAHLKLLTRRNPIAPRPFVASLPQRLLSHPRGGALAVIGHVERAWGCSFFDNDRQSRQLQTFQSTVGRLLDGWPVGWALEYFNQLYAALSTELSKDLEDVQYGKTPDAPALSRMWTSNNDARSYVVIGDPAVRVPPASNGAAARGRPVVSSAGVTAPVAVAKTSPDAPPAGEVSFDVGGSSTWVDRNDPDRLRRRLARLGLDEADISALLNGAVPAGAGRLGTSFGRSDLVEAQTLATAVKAARAVGLIRVGTSGKTAPALLIAPRLLLTAGEILASDRDAASGSVMFEPSESFALAPADFFLNEPGIGFTLVAAAPASAGGVDLSDFEWARPAEGDDPILVGERFHAVRYPDGSPKRVAFHAGRVAEWLPEVFRHDAVAEPGSVFFNAQWEPVGIQRGPRGEGDSGRAVRLSRVLAFVNTRWPEGPPPFLREALSSADATAGSLASTTLLLPLTVPGGAPVTIPLRIEVKPGRPFPPVTGGV